MPFPTRPRRRRAVPALVLGLALATAGGTAAPRPAEAGGGSEAVEIGLAAAALFAGAVALEVWTDRTVVGNGGRTATTDAVIGAGVYGLEEDDDGTDRSALGRVELRFKQEVFRVRPFIGVEGTTDASFYGYGGLMVDLWFTDNIVVSPNAAVGLYHEGDGRDLGHPVEFRTGVEAGWGFDNGWRVTAAVHHLSNAGLSDDNPGIETATINLSIPLN